METDAHSPTNRYPEVSPRADFPAIEGRILERWAKDGTFQASIDQHASEEDGGELYVFNDGPPFANGLPHYGHLLTGYVKDIVPRYQTMRGKRVERRFGWDTHGLPAEMETEKELGVSGRRAIVDFGIKNFNEACAASVMRYTTEWESYVTRQARWVNFEDDYKTMDLDYMESVMWAFKQLYDKGLVYEAHRVMPYSWGAETPLANFEIRLDDATRPRQDPALTVGFELDETLVESSTTRVLAWTTTPWTLPSNMGLAVGPDIAYVLMRSGDTTYVLAEAALGSYAKELSDFEQVGAISGSELTGLSYKPLFDYFSGLDGAFRVVSADFVETGDGTGVVHIAPGFGEEDQRVGEENGIPLVVPVDDSGKFTEEISDFAGLNVFDANPKVIAWLKDIEGVVLRHETYDHNYPHCWRTDTPVIYRAINSWFVRVTDFRDRLVELNQEINWIPDHVRDGQFGRWLEGARDWSISRNRFWGAPIPIWRSDNPDYPRLDVYGSLDELEADFGVRPTNLHRPFIDDLVRPNPDDPSGQSMMRRVPEVLDCWFESGSMPYAQLHYPFENEDYFEAHNPADFIVEYTAQTRGWFYTMHVLGTALFDKPAFSNVICHGTLLDSDGVKLSKKLRNYPDPLAVFDDVGSDAMRWYLISSPILRGLDTRIEKDDSGIRDVVRHTLNPLWNAYSFFTLYANAEGYSATERTDSANLLDRYILAKTHQLVRDMTDSMDNYQLANACDHVQTFLDALTNWYIRRSRERFWNTDPEVELDTEALDTLFTILRIFSRVAAPLLPLTTEEIWLGLNGDEGSVHLETWPSAADIPSDDELVAAMDQLRQAASAALSLREDRNLRVRLPLASATLAGPTASAIEPFAELLASEINVKQILFTDEVQAYGSFRLQPDGRVLGPKIGKDVQKVIKAAKAGEWSANDDGTVSVAGHVLVAEEFSLALDPLEGVAAAPLPGNRVVIALDVELTEELEAEGRARDMVRQIQQMRKDRGFHPTDRIRLQYGTLPAGTKDHLDWISREVLSLETTQSLGIQPMPGYMVEGEILQVMIDKIDQPS